MVVEDFGCSLMSTGFLVEMKGVGLVSDVETLNAAMCACTCNGSDARRRLVVSHAQQVYGSGRCVLCHGN